MSSIFRKPKTPDLPPQPEAIEDIKVVQEEADVAARKEKKKILRGGRRKTIISGITSALKQRLGR